MATITGANVESNTASTLRQTPETYTTVNALAEITKDLVMPDLVEAYGDQGITGFLELTGAIQKGGTSDQTDWFETGRRHQTLAFTGAAATSNVLTFAVVDGTNTLQPQDVIMNAAGGKRYLVNSITATTVVCVALDGGTTATPSPTTGALIHLGNMYAQGTDQPAKFMDPKPNKRSNPFMICKDRYQVNGSQATNIGWVNLGNGEYRWFMYGETEARKRYKDKREMMCLFGEIMDGNTSTTTPPLAGSEGYVTAVADRGINIQNAASNSLDSFNEFDALILELDKQGAGSEYAMYLNRAQDLAIDDMLASGVSTGVTAGLAGQFGAFNNNADMAVKLGFKSFTRGGYTFHKHDWKLLNDPTLLGASDYLQGAMIPLTKVVDPKTGKTNPALTMYHKEANGYSREMEHWVTGGGVLGHTNNGDAGTDVATFHYRSEIALVTRAANQHVIIRG